MPAISAEGRPKHFVSPRQTEHLPSLPSGVDDALLPLLLTLSDVMGCDWQHYLARS